MLRTASRRSRRQCGNRGIATIPLRYPLPVPAQPCAWRPPLRHSSGARPSPGSPRHPGIPGRQQTASFERTGQCQPESIPSARCFPLLSLSAMPGPFMRFLESRSCLHARMHAKRQTRPAVPFSIMNGSFWNTDAAGFSSRLHPQRPQPVRLLGCPGAGRCLRCRAPVSGLVPQRIHEGLQAPAPRGQNWRWKPSSNRLRRKS